ncbi:MAG: helix-turn-helix domain-containing protein [Roseibium sp.]|nr:helix-turn-helix domain-containing protein [Roseibium sp.]
MAMPLEDEWARADVLRILRDRFGPETIDWQEVATKYNFCLSVIDDPQGVVSIPVWFGVFEDIAERLGDDAVFFDMFNTLEVGTFSVFDYLFVHAATLRDGCQAWERFIPIRTNAYRMRFVEGAEQSYLDWPVLEGRGVWRQNVFARTAWAARQFELALDVDVAPIHIEIAAPPPNRMSRFQEKYGDRLRFNGQYNRISFASHLLSVPLQKNEDNLYSIILRAAVSELSVFKSMDSPISQVANQIAASLTSGKSTLPEIAARVGLSQGSLQRLLDQEGTSFRKLTDDIRRAAAERYLKNTDLPLKEVAFLLGFSDLSTFSRAVKGWFGISPRRVRDSLHGQGDLAAI